MLESTIVSQRLVYEGIRREGGPTAVNITPEMEKMVACSHPVYKTARVEANKNQSIVEKKRIEKRKATLDLKSAVASKKAAVEELKSKIDV